MKNMFETGLHSDIHEPISFKHGKMIDMTKLHIDTSMNDLDLFLTSQGNGKTGTCVIIQL